MKKIHTRKRIRIDPNSCPCCGSRLEKVSGIVRCQNCGNAPGLFGDVADLENYEYDASFTGRRAVPTVKSED